MKKIICLLLSLVLTVSFLSSCSDTHDKTTDSESVSESSDNTQENSSLNNGSAVTESPVEDFKYKFSEDNERVFITQYIGTSKNVVIPSKIEGRIVTSLIGYQVDGFLHGVFQDTDIETVVIPDTIKGTSGRTFKDCTFLYSVTIKQNSELRDIGNEDFRNCSSLKIINLEDAKKLKSIGSYAFNNCSSIERIILPENLESIEFAGFSECPSLKSVNIPSKLNLLPNDFRGLRFSDLPVLEEIVFSEDWKTINGYMFFGISSNVSIIIPKGVTSISVCLFGNGGDGHVNLYFLGDCPQITDGDRFSGDVTIYYDPNTTGWDTTQLKETHALIPR